VELMFGNVPTGMGPARAPQRLKPLARARL
jgi:hypothetical protein